MNFKAQVERDLTAVFHNAREHADVMEFWIDGCATKALSSLMTAAHRTGKAVYGPCRRLGSLLTLLYMSRYPC